MALLPRPPSSASSSRSVPPTLPYPTPPQVYIFLIGLVFSLTLPMANHVDYDVRHGEYSFGYSLSDLFRPVHGDGSNHEHAWKKMCLVLLLGVGMVGMQGLRNGGMAVSRDSTVVIALYFEVALAFLWTAAILRDDLNVYQFVGCAVIVLGSSTVLVLKGMEERRLLARDKGVAFSASSGYSHLVDLEKNLLAFDDLNHDNHDDGYNGYNADVYRGDSDATDQRGRGSIQGTELAQSRTDTNTNQAGV